MHSVELKERVLKNFKEERSAERAHRNLKSIPGNTKCYVRLRDGISDTFTSYIGPKKGSILSPLLFNTMLDEAVINADDI